MIEQFRKQHPEYDDMPTPELCAALHAKYYADMPKDEFDRQFIGRPNHDDLEAAAVRGKDSLDLQDKDPSVKPAVKMTLQEFGEAQIDPAKPFFSLGNGEVYVFAPGEVDLQFAVSNIISGDDSELLGYPEPGDSDCCVTKDGEVLTDLPSMHEHAKNGNIAWAASGSDDELRPRAERVSIALHR